MSQVHIKTNEQAESLITFLQHNVGGDEGALLTQQGENVYASTGLASATISPDGDVDVN